MRLIAILLGGLIAAVTAAPTMGQAEPSEAKAIEIALGLICGWHFEGTESHEMLEARLSGGGWSYGDRAGVLVYDRDAAWGYVDVKVGGSGGATRCFVTVSPSDPPPRRDGEAAYAVIAAIVAKWLPNAEQVKARAEVPSPPGARLSAWNAPRYQMQVLESPVAVGEPMLQVIWDKRYCFPRYFDTRGFDGRYPFDLTTKG